MQLIIPLIAPLTMVTTVEHAKRMKLAVDQTHEGQTPDVRTETGQILIGAGEFLTIMNLVYGHCAHLNIGVDFALEKLNEQLCLISLQSRGDWENIISSCLRTWKKASSRHPLQSKILCDLFDRYIKQEVSLEPENTEGAMPFEVSAPCKRVCYACSKLDKWVRGSEIDEGSYEEPLKLQMGHHHTKHIQTRLIRGYKQRQMISEESWDRGRSYLLINRSDTRQNRAHRNWEKQFSKAQTWIMSLDQPSLQAFLGPRYREIIELRAMRTTRTLNPSTLLQSATPPNSTENTPAGLISAHRNTSAVKPGVTVLATVPAGIYPGVPAPLPGHTPASTAPAMAHPPQGTGRPPSSVPALPSAPAHLTTAEERFRRWTDLQKRSNAGVQRATASTIPAKPALPIPPLSGPTRGQKRTAAQMDSGVEVIDLTEHD